MPPKKKVKKKVKPVVKQKQKQKQSQKVVVNIGTLRRPRRRRVAPRPTSYQQNTSRILSQFVQPEAMLPQRTIYPVSLPPSFNITSPSVLNESAPRPPVAQMGAVSGSPELPTAPLMTPAQSAKAGLAAEARQGLENKFVPPSNFWDGGSTFTAPAPAQMTEENNPEVMRFRANAKAAEALRESGVIPQIPSARTDRFGLIPPSQEQLPSPLTTRPQFPMGLTRANASSPPTTPTPRDPVRRRRLKLVKPREENE